MKISKTMAAAVGAGLVVAGLMTVSPASADPVGTPAGTSRNLVGVGSDTTQNVMNDLSEVVQISGVKQIASWDATGTGTFQTRASAACTYSRTEANGSGAGRSRLIESLTAGNSRSGCLDFARSSSSRGTFTTAAAVSVAYVPFAKDASTYITRTDGGVARSGLTQTDVNNVYKCAFLPDINPILPQTGSGSRSFWLTTVGITEQDIDNGLYTCLVPTGTVAGQKAVTAISRASNVVTATVPSAVTGLAVGNSVDVVGVSGFNGTFTVTAILTGPARIQWAQTAADATGTVVSGTSFAYKTGSAAGTGRPYVQENDGRGLKTDEMMPFSIGLWNAQSAGNNNDVRGALNVLAQIDSKLPVATSVTFPVTRDLFNIIPTAKVTDGVTDAFDTVFIGSSSLICQQTQTIIDNGFIPLTTGCGDTSSRT